MVQVDITTELPADEFGPHEFFRESIVLPSSFATDAREAHAKLLTLIVTERYVELPEDGSTSVLPLNTSTVRALAVWER